MRYFCTVSDWHYLGKALVLYESLKRHCKGDWVLVCLCIELETYNKLCDLRLERLDARLASRLGMGFDASDSRYRDPRGKRSPYNMYCMSLASRFCYFVMDRDKPQDGVTHLDCDLIFYHDPQLFYDEIGDKSVGIVPHFHNKVGDSSGAYNCSFVYFANDRWGCEALRKWEYWVSTPDNPESTKYGTCADQKYLELFPIRFALDCCIIRDTALQGGPWNFRLFDWSRFRPDNRVVRLKKNFLPLVYLHFSKFKYDHKKDRYQPGGAHYHKRLFRGKWVKWLYHEYYETLRDIHGRYELCN